MPGVPSQDAVLQIDQPQVPSANCVGDVGRLDCQVADAVGMKVAKGSEELGC